MNIIKTFNSTLDFVDGGTARAVLEIGATRIRFTTIANNVPNVQMWDRAHVAGLSVTAIREGVWMPTLVLSSGKEVTLGFVMDQPMVRSMTDVF